jgi:signal transduction histidine kinase
VAPLLVADRPWLSRVAGKIRQRPWRRLGRMTIRYKLAAVMGVPSVALSSFLVYEIIQLAGDVEAVRRESALATSADGPTGLFLALQNERNFAVTDLFGQGDIIDVDVAGYPETRGRTDEALDGFEELLAHSQDQTVAAYAPAVERLQADLEPLRDRIDAYDGPKTVAALRFADEVYADYEELIEPFLQGTSSIVDVVGHAELARGAALVDTDMRLIETIAGMVRGTIVYAVLSEGGVDTPEEIGQVAVWRDRFVRYTSRLEAETVGVYARARHGQALDEWNQEVLAHVDSALSTGRVDMTRFLDTVTLPEERSYIGYQHRVASILRAEAERLTDAAASRQQAYLLVVALILLVAVAAMWVVGQSIVSSLRTLTRQAADVARRRLPAAVGSVLDTPAGEDVAVPRPDPVVVGSHDEVADVAEALNTVQQSALDLAAGQAMLRRNIADSFVNLGLRNQSLLSRQLTFITELETGETNPDNLANLSHLDHLAIRMRRNADSLLVLAGVRAARSEMPRDAMPIADVIRAAVHEVEDYERVVAPAVEPVGIAGPAVADVVHLLAELVDNALSYSPPARTAEIRGLGHPAGYTLTVTDKGMGMSPDDLARANRRLGGSEPFTVAPSKYLGHYVAGHLAAHHGIQVRLQGAPTFGVTATVHIPHDVLVTEAALVR